MDVAGAFGQMALEAARTGSPDALQGAGRILGFGPAEWRAAFGQNPEPAVPRWALVTLSLAGGLFLGAYLQRRWPSRARKVFGG